MSEPGKVFVIPTIISPGQYGTIPPDVRDVINSLDYFLVENIRTARRFISGLNLGLVIEDLSFRQVDKNTSPFQIEELVRPVKEGRSVGLLSESGCPGIADPGALVVAHAHKVGIRVIPLVGPSSLLLALMASGFNGQSFVFHGYLPILAEERKRAIKRIEQESLRLNQTQLFIETPYRNQQMFESLLGVCHPATFLCVARDITGKEEMVESCRISDWKFKNPKLHKIPVIFLLYRHE